MARKIKATVAAITFMVIGLTIFAPSASAFGQCGGSVSTGSQLFHEWQAMGVVPQAEKVVQSAGFHRMDGSLKNWMGERVVKAKLASSAAPGDFGCHPGVLFSVGPRTIAKGTPVMVALPSKFAKGEVRLTPHKGFKRIVISAHIVGKSSCSNPNEGVVQVVIFVKAPKRHHRHHKPKLPPPAGQTCNVNQTLVGGVCVNAQQQCENRGGIWNSNNNMCTIVVVVGNCSNITVVNGSGNVVSTSQEGNCNVTINETPKPKPSIMITGNTELNMIPAGKTSGPFEISTYASESGGTLTVDPGIGSVSSCNSSTPEVSFTTSVPSGASKQCVILYAPEDAAKPASMTVTMTANLGSASDQKTKTVPITYPTRP